MIIATHVVPDIEFIAKEVLLLNHGKITDSGTPTELCSEIENKVFEVLIEPSALSEIQGKMRVANITHEGEKLCVRVVSNIIPEYECRTAVPTLEDLYLYKFGE